MNESTHPIRLLIVDDSALVRRAVADSLAGDPEIEVVGTACDPYEARDKILQLNPDVLTLDIEMPRMDGLTFLGLLMKSRPTRVLVMSSLTAAGSEKALQALHLGAVDVLDKPSGSRSAHTEGRMLADKIKAAARARLRGQPADATAQASRAPAVSTRAARRFNPRSVILIGASTGGTEALRTVLTGLPFDMPGIAIVQHIPAKFSLALANRLNNECAIKVREARHGELLEPGLALLAPGGQHMVLRWTGTQYIAQLNEGPLVHHQRPAVDVLFDSAVKCGAAPHAMGMVLTGMGADGADGLVALRKAGSVTVAQNEETCVVFGMPREAILRGGAQEVLPLGGMAARMNRFAAHTVLNGA